MTSSLEERAGQPSAPATQVSIGLMGLGVVGSGVAKVLQEKAAYITQEIGCPIDLRRVLVRDMGKARDVDLPEACLTTDPEVILSDPDISIVIELMGGEDPAFHSMEEALRRGKHVITANKEVIAKHGPHLLSLAERSNTSLLYEASVGGGIPLIAPFRESLLANDISTLHAIINGTTNYILSNMASGEQDFADSLREAQALGYAEADPTNDIEGIDASYKLAILASLAFHTAVSPEQVFKEGITKLTARDFRYARELGYAIKLLAIAKREDDAIEVRVHPAFYPLDRILSKVDGVFNAVEVEGDLTGRVMFYGRGAGSLPTTSAVVANLVELARAVQHGSPPPRLVQHPSSLKVRAIEQTWTRYYLRMNVRDESGVLGQIAQVLGGLKISIASVIQKESDDAAQQAEIVLMTHRAQEGAVQQAIQELSTLSCVASIGTLVRVEG